MRFRFRTWKCLYLDRFNKRYRSQTYTQGEGIRIGHDVWSMRLLNDYYQLQSFTSSMKRPSNAGEVKPTKKPKTNADITSKLLNNIQDTLCKQLSAGKMAINPVRKALPQYQNLEALRSSNPEEYFQIIEQGLKVLRSSIDDQRRAQKEHEKVKLQQAQELIDRMRRQKQQHQQKMRDHSNQQVLHRRLYSDTTLHKMREKLQQRIIDKRIQIEERVKAIEERKAKRGEQAVNQELQYWQFRKELKEKTKSSAKLPTIPITQENNSFLPSLTRNNSLAILPPAKQHQQYERQASRLQRLAKMKQENLQLKKFEENYSNRLENIIRGHQSLHERLVAEPSFKSTHLIPSYVQNRHKIMGNEFLKESLLKIKKNSNTNTSNDPQSSGEEAQGPTAHEAHINKNSQVEALREKWTRMLSKVRHAEITQEQGLEILNNIEKRLDKVDMAGVKNRLKQKYEVFSGELPLSHSLGKAESESVELGS